MAIHFAAKAPGDALRYTWVPPIVAGDSILTATITRTSGTAAVEEYEIDADGVVMLLSGGAGGETTVLAASITTGEGEELTETIYLPVIASASQIAGTAREYCNFALRKIVGNGVDAEAVELDDALERLNGLVAKWRAGGADIGAPFPLTANSVIYCPDWAVDGLRYNLRISCHDHYDAPITAFDANEARRGLQLIKHKSLPATREGADFF